MTTRQITTRKITTRKITTPKTTSQKTTNRKRTTRKKITRKITTWKISTRKITTRKKTTRKTQMKRCMDETPVPFEHNTGWTDVATVEGGIGSLIINVLWVNVPDNPYLRHGPVIAITYNIEEGIEAHKKLSERLGRRGYSQLWEFLARGILSISRSKRFCTKFK